MDVFDDGFPTVVTIEGSVQHSSSIPVLPGDAETSGFTDLQSRFIDAYCRLGDGTAAAIEAGYGGGAKNMATRNLLKPKIQAEIERRVKAGRGSVLLKATTRLLQIIEGSSDERAVVQAALGMMDRFGMAVPKGPLIDARTVNIGAGEVQSILADVVAKRQARLSRQSDG